MLKKIKKVSKLNIAINFFLTILNIFVGVAFSSISFISKGIDSIQDFLTSIIIFFSIKLNNKKNDESHQFGHSRAENLAGYTIGIFMLFLGIEIIYTSFEKLFSPSIVKYNNLLFYVIFIGIFLKSFLYFYIKGILKEIDSPSLKANIQDHFNDVLIYLGILIGILFIKNGYFFVDSIIGIIIGLTIVYNSLRISFENINYLMGKSASNEIKQRIIAKTKLVPDILEVNLCKTQYLGNKLQVEIHIALDKNINLEKAHKIANEVREKLKQDKLIISCFVHIDPYIRLIKKY